MVAEQKYCSSGFGRCDFKSHNSSKDADLCSLVGYCCFQLPKINHFQERNDDNECAEVC